MQVTLKMERAVANAVGYEVDPGIIEEILDNYKGIRSVNLLSELNRYRREFRRAGGRGVDLAENIDALRIALAARKAMRRGR